MKTTIKYLINFYKHPDFDKSYNNLSYSQQLKELIQVYFITLLVVFTLSILNLILVKTGIVNSYHSIVDINDANNTNMLKWYYIFGLFLTPIFEEISFRLLLTKFNARLISISLSLIFGTLLYNLIRYHLFIFNSPIIQNLSFYFYPILFAIPIFFIFNLIKFRFRNHWNTFFPYVFYFFNIIFAFFHLFRLSVHFNDIVFLPIILSQYFVLGVSFGYIRIKLGILYSIIFHFVWNFPYFLIKLLEIYK